MRSKQLPQQVARGSPKKNNIFCDISTAKYIHGKGGKVGEARVWRDTEKYKSKPDEITS